MREERGDRPTSEANNSRYGREEGSSTDEANNIGNGKERESGREEERLDKKNRKPQEKKDDKCKVIPQVGAPVRDQAPPA